MNMANKQSESARILLGLLRDPPVAEEMDITVLHVDDDSTGSTSSGEETYPRDAFAKQGVHLGLNASDLPKLARDFRKDYYSTRSIFRSANSPNAGYDPDTDHLALASHIIDAITCLLTVCPDNATAWSDRKRALLLIEQHKNGLTEDISSELSFLDLLFSQHSKAPNSWAHRKWLGHKIVKKISSASYECNAHDYWESLQSWAKREIDVCTKVAEKFPKNYYAWTHRSFVVQMVTASLSASGCTRSVQPVAAFLSKELSFSETWLSRHISDHSAAHYGSEILRKIMWHFSAVGGAHASQPACLAEAKRALSVAGDLCNRFASHEVIWIWRRLCATVFIEVACGLFGSKSAASDIHPFIQNEVVALSEENLLGSLESAEILDYDEVHSIQVHSVTYILWALDQLKRIDCKCWDSDLDTMCQSLAEKLANDDCITCNLWRVKC